MINESKLVGGIGNRIDGGWSLCGNSDHYLDASSSINILLI